MEDAVWNFTVPIYPVNFGQISRSTLQYVSTFVNKFVPGLQGLLIEYDKSSLCFITDDKLDGGLVALGLFHIQPVLAQLRIKAKINVRVFRPRSGLELTATVAIHKPHVILCNTSIPYVNISLPRYLYTSNDMNCAMKTADELDKLKPNDLVKVRISSITQNFGSYIIRGEFVELLPIQSAMKQAILKKFEDSSSEEDESSSNLVATSNDGKVKELQQMCKLEPLSSVESELVSSRNVPNSDLQTKRCSKRKFKICDVPERKNDQLTTVASTKCKKIKNTIATLGCKSEPV